jgi:cytochrome c553
MMHEHGGSSNTARKAQRAVVGFCLGLLITTTTDKAGATSPRHLTIEACAACHGEDGIARGTEVPHLAGQNERYLYNQMLAFRSGRRPHREMKIMARDLSLEEIASIAAYYAALPAR